MKVETHNHPTAISPFPGASTGSGGEIRDEGATGRGSKPKAGLAGFSVGNLHLPGTERAVGALAGGQARAHRQRAADHDRRPAGRRRVQQRVRPPEPGRLLPRVRAGRRRRHPRLPQAHHDRRRPGRDPRRPDPQDRVPGRHAAGAAGRPGHAHRHGRRRRQLDGGRHQHRRARLRLGAARQPRDPAPRAGGHQPVLAAGRGQPDPGDPRRGRGRPVQRVPRAGRRRRRGRHVRPARGAAGRVRPGAQGDLVQREPGALRPGDRARVAAAAAGASPSASAARWRWSAAPPSTRRWCWKTAPAATRAIDMPMDVLFGKPPKMLRDVARVERSEQAARPDRRDAGAGRARRAAPSDRRLQALPDHHRRPHRGRPVAPRPDGRPVAGAGGRRRRHAGRLQGLRRRGDEHGRAHAAGRASTRRPRAAWRWPRPSPTCWPRRSSCRASSCRCNWMAACGEPGEDAALYDTVRAVGMELCPALGISVPVGKDSLSMRTTLERRRPGRSRSWRRCR